LAHRLTRAELIQNPILLDHFEIQPYPAVNGTIHCAVVGRFCISDKGQDILISMFGEDGWKAADIKLHLYGKGEDQEYLEQLIAYYGAGDKVTIEGFSENKNEIWDKCHCLLMCSHSEGTPLTLLEAMVAGRVCIVTRVGGNEEWIEDGENGFLVDAPTGRLFGGKLKEALERVGEWERIGKAAHDHARGKMESNPGKMLVEKIMSARAGSR